MWQTLKYYIKHVQYVGEIDHPIDHNKTSNCTRFILWCYIDVDRKELDPCLSVIVQWSKDNDTYMDMLSHYCGHVIWGMDNVWKSLTIS